MSVNQGGSRSRCLLFSCVAAFLHLVHVIPAAAHETWILAGSARVESPRTIPLAITSGMVFPRPDTGIPAERLSRSGIRIGKQEFGLLLPHKETAPALIASAPLTRPGIACVWLALPALPVELTPELVQAYFEEIQADPEIRRAWAARKNDLWRERYEKFAKTILRVGEVNPGDRSWADPIGGVLEIVPEVDPTAIVSDAPFPVRVLKNGRPLAGLMLAAQANGKHEWQRTNANGRATFRLQGSGPWLIHGTELRAPKALEAEWRSWFTTLTIQRQVAARQ